MIFYLSNPASTGVRLTATYANVGRLNPVGFRKYSYFNFGWHVSFWKNRETFWSAAVDSFELGENVWEKRPVCFWNE